MPIRPPIAEPKTIPTRYGSKPFRPESATASFAAPRARTTLRSKRRSSFGGASPSGSKSLTSAAMRTGRPSASNARIQSIPLSPATAARQVPGAVFPTGVIAPRPVTTTRRTGRNLRGDARLPEREVGELVPVGLDLLRHRLFVLAVLARDLGGFLVSGRLRDALEELVARDLEVLGRVAVAGVAAGLLGAGHVDDALHQRVHDPGGLADGGRRGVVCLAPPLAPGRGPPGPAARAGTRAPRSRACGAAARSGSPRPRGSRSSRRASAGRSAPW